MQEELSSLKLPELPPLKDLSICSLKMFPACCHMTKGGLLKPSSVHWMNWGTMCRGRCLTARIIMSPKLERECSLSDFLETDVPAEYYLSQKQTRKLLSNAYPGTKETESTPQKE